MAYESWDINLSSEALEVDGEIIESVVPGYRTLNVSGRESLEYRITEEEKPVGMDGMDYYGKSHEGRTLTVRFLLSRTDSIKFMESYRELKKFLLGDNRKLVFQDEPNRYYIGFLKSISQPEEGQIRIIGEMEFYCPDPYIYEDAITTVTAKVENGILTAHVDNNCSVPVYPVYRVKNTGDENGYIGIVHEGGALEVGSKEEADTESYTASVSLIRTKSSGFGSFQAYTGTHPQNSKILCNGTLRVATRPVVNSEHKASNAYQALWLDNAGSQTSSCDAYGGCRRYTLTTAAQDCYAWFNEQFCTGAMGQCGHLQITFADENNKLICAQALSKIDKTGNSAYTRFYYGDSNGNSRVFKTINISPTVYYPDNAYSSRGYNDMLKEGGKITWYHYGKYYSATFSHLANKKVKYVYVFIGNHRACPKRTTVMTIGDIEVRDLKQVRYRDIPNRFSNGAEITIDCEKDQVRVKGQLKNDELVVGSAFHALKPGKSTIEFYKSSWATGTLSATVEYRKRWL